MPTHDMKAKNDIVKETNNSRLMRLDGLWDQGKITAIIAITLPNDNSNKVLPDGILLYSYIQYITLSSVQKQLIKVHGN